MPRALHPFVRWVSGPALQPMHAQPSVQRLQLELEPSNESVLLGPNRDTGGKQKKKRGGGGLFGVQYVKTDKKGVVITHDVSISLVSSIFFSV